MAAIPSGQVIPRGPSERRQGVAARRLRVLPEVARFKGASGCERFALVVRDATISGRRGRQGIDSRDGFDQLLPQLAEMDGGREIAPMREFEDRVEDCI